MMMWTAPESSEFPESPELSESLDSFSVLFFDKEYHTPLTEHVGFDYNLTIIFMTLPSFLENAKIEDGTHCAKNPKHIQKLEFFVLEICSIQQENLTRT